MNQIYIAGPLFTKGQRDLLEQIDQVCRDCAYATYLPHRDAGIFTREDNSSLRFFRNDLVQLDESAIVVAVLNGVDVDSGTSWEMGYFYAANKPVIGYINDSRIFDPSKQINPMIINSVQIIVRNIEELRHELNQI